MQIKKTEVHRFTDVSAEPTGTRMDSTFNNRSHFNRNYRRLGGKPLKHCDSYTYRQTEGAVVFVCPLTPNSNEQRALNVWSSCSEL